MNLSETAFVMPRENGYDLRWFTPTVEVDLCGHATLASAHILWETGRLGSDHAACFHTKSGVHGARRVSLDDADWIELDFPSFSAEVATPPAELLEGLGTQPTSVSLATAGHNYVVELKSEAAVRRLLPDFDLFRQLKMGVIVTARGDDQHVDFVSRYFGSPYGIDEDPVTGSAHCALGPYWQARLGKSEFVAHQVSRRGGILRVRVAGERTRIAGQAVTVLRGELTELAADFD